MFRKNDLENVPIMFDAPESWKERQIVHSALREDGTGSRVDVMFVDSKDIDRTILDPRVVTIGKIIESGQVIDPKNWFSMFNITDPADLEAKRQQLGENMYSYLLDHKDEIVPAQSATVVEPNKD